MKTNPKNVILAAEQFLAGDMTRKSDLIWIRDTLPSRIITSTREYATMRELAEVIVSLGITDYSDELRVAISDRFRSM